MTLLEQLKKLDADATWQDDTSRLGRLIDLCIKQQKEIEGLRRDVYDLQQGYTAQHD